MKVTYYINDNFVSAEIVESRQAAKKLKAAWESISDDNYREAAIGDLLPSVKDMATLVKSVKPNIDDDSRSFDEATLPCIQLTVGWDDKTGEWSFQTGDNSFTGGAYHCPHWAVVDVFRRSNSIELAKEIRSQLAELDPAYR